MNLLLKLGRRLRQQLNIFVVVKVVGPFLFFSLAGMRSRICLKKLKGTTCLEILASS